MDVCLYVSWSVRTFPASRFGPAPLRSNSYYASGLTSALDLQPNLLLQLPNSNPDLNATLRDRFQARYALVCNCKNVTPLSNLVTKWAEFISNYCVWTEKVLR